MNKAVINFRFLFLNVLLSACSAPNQTAIPENNVQQLISTKDNKIEPPPMEVLGQGARAPTKDELLQEQQFNDQQISVAERWLKSSDPHQRIMGAEQLSAFESPRAEQLLVNVLLNTKESELRIASAHSLGGFKNLSNTGLEALLTGLGNADKNSRLAALNAVFEYAANVELDSQKSTDLIQKLQKKLSKGNLANDVRDQLNAFINDKKSPSNIFFSNSGNMPSK